jgi:hypothetical protein
MTAIDASLGTAPAKRTKRRRRAGIACSLIGIALICLLGYWFFAAERPFAFLSARKPLHIAAPAQKALDKQFGGRCKLYAFKATPKDVEAMRNELVSSGFDYGFGGVNFLARGDQAKLDSFRLDQSRYRTLAAAHPDLEMVIIYENLRHYSDTNPRRMLWAEEAAGWVTVLVRESNQKSMMNQLQEFLGGRKLRQRPSRAYLP